MDFEFHLEPGTDTPHCTYGHGVSTETVKEAFQKPMRQWQEGNVFIRLCKANEQGDILKIVFKWLTQQKVKIITAYYWYP